MARQVYDIVTIIAQVNAEVRRLKAALARPASQLRSVSALPASGTDGDIVYLTTDDKVYVRSNGAWEALAFEP